MNSSIRVTKIYSLNSTAWELFKNIIFRLNFPTPLWIWNLITAILNGMTVWSSINFIVQSLKDFSPVVQRRSQRSSFWQVGKRVNYLVWIQGRVRIASTIIILRDHVCVCNNHIMFDFYHINLTTQKIKHANVFCRRLCDIKTRLWSWKLLWKCTAR